MAKAKTKEQLELGIQRRTMVGTRATKRLRREGVIPAVVYGHQMDPVAITVDAKEFIKVLHSKAGEHALVKLRLQDGKPWEKPTLVKEIQHDPVDGRVLHVDFHAIALTEAIRLKIPVVLTGEPAGVKEASGVLEQFLREIEIECLPTDIPGPIEFDVSAMKIGDTLHVRDLPQPAKAKVVADPQSSVASVQAPKVEKPPELAEPAAEPEVIREKKEETEGAAAPEAAKGEAKGEAKGGAKAKEPGEKGDKKEGK
jgi:large subunit ribosomal protein L25